MFFLTISPSSRRSATEFNARHRPAHNRGDNGCRRSNKEVKDTSEPGETETEEVYDTENDDVDTRDEARCFCRALGLGSKNRAKWD